MAVREVLFWRQMMPKLTAVTILLMKAEVVVVGRVVVQVVAPSKLSVIQSTLMELCL